MERLDMNHGLWEDLFDIVSEWILEHPKLSVEELVDDIYDYVREEYGPPF
jgi:hypothetical protein